MASLTDHQVLIVSSESDLHALAINQRLLQVGVCSHVIESNILSGTPSLSWRSRRDNTSTIVTREGRTLSPADCDVIWWRRTNSPQVSARRYTQELGDLEHIDSSCKTTLAGLLLTTFGGLWVSEPFASSRAENKLIQLHTAMKVGMHIPDTLVSQDPDAIRQFWHQHNKQVIVKPVCGARTRPLFTQRLADEYLESDLPLMLSPAIYQEYVPGVYHLRVNCFGDQVVVCRIQASEVDWRVDWRRPFVQTCLDSGVEVQLQRILNHLQLEMGVFDLKLRESGEAVFLELNPQGQFLFLDPLAGTDLVGACSDFLRRCAERGRRTRLAAL